MSEWILILTLSITASQGIIRDPSPTIVSGFQSKQNCEAAAATISQRLILLIGKGREQQGIASNTSKGAPAIWYECTSIKK